MVAYPATMAQRTARVVSDDAVMGGEPRIEGRRITVRQVAEWVEEAGLSAKTVADRYDLDVADSTTRSRTTTNARVRWRRSSAGGPSRYVTPVTAGCGRWPISTRSDGVSRPL